jgi:predicted Zn-dependent protease
MRSIRVLLPVLFLLQAALAQFPAPAQQQQTLTQQQIIERVCKGPEIKTGPEYDKLTRVLQKLSAVVNQDTQHHSYVALANSDVINAWAVNANMTVSLVCVPVAMVRFMGDGDGELAFIIAHEIGHTVDDTCKTSEGRLAVANSRGSLGSLFGGLVGGQQGAIASSQVSQQRGCEARADEIGFKIFTASGYDPFDAAGAFGRLEMYSGDTHTGILARLSALGSDHPMTPDRISRMRTLLLNQQMQAAAGRGGQ